MNVIKELPKPVKIAILAILTIIVVGSLVIATILVLNTVRPQSDGTKDETSQIEALKEDAAKAEIAGNTDDAIAQYKQLLLKYNAGGDKDAAADAQAKIKQLNNVKDAQKKIDEQAATDAKQRAADAGFDMSTEPTN